MPAILAHSGYIAVRHLRNFVRQPWLVAINLVQPFLWLLLFGSLFTRVAEIPGFTAANYADFLTPGVVVMTVLFASGWNGLSLLGDMERGTLERVLVTPVRRGAVINGPVIQQAVIGLVPTAIIMAIGYRLGARYEGGIVGVAVFLLAVTILSVALAGFSNAVALLVRREESLIALVNFIVMPLTFLSTALMPAELVPPWVATIARFNPVTWAIDVGRQSLGGHPDWARIGLYLALLSALALAFMAAALRAFRAYQRSV